MKLRKHIKNIYDYFRENAQFDIKYTKEGKRIYNKIKKNIHNIKFEATPNDDISEFIKDSRGNLHLLKGVKFNLKDIKEKYDLDILFCNEIGKINNHHYDPNENRLVFFILSQNQDELNFEQNSYLARLRFDNWIDEKVFVHEFIHFIDSDKYSDTYRFKTPQTDNEYYNSPEEYNSYSHEIISEILKNKKKLIGLNFNDFFKNSLKYGNQNFIKNLNGIYMKKLKKRIYKLFIEFRNE